MPDDLPQAGLSPFVLPLETFDRIASGSLDVGAVRLLQSTERSRLLLLMHHLLATCARHPSLLEPIGGIEPTKTLLDAVQDHDAALLDEQLAYPQTGMWLAHAVRRLADLGHDPTPPWVHLGTVAALAASVAIRARIPFEIDVPTVGGQVMLPRLGRVDLAVEDKPCGVATVRGTHDGFVVDHSGGRVSVPRPFSRDRPRWTPIPVLYSSSAGGRPLTVRLDGLDPAPELVGLPPAASVSGTTQVLWQERLDAAWQLLDTDHPEDAEALATGFTAVVPLEPGGPVQAGSSAEGFGAASVSLLPPVDLACALVHEFHHSALNGLLHMVRLCTPHDGAAVHYAPWRDDPRPFMGIVHGAYAFTAVTDFWQRRWRAGVGADARRAELEFALWRLQTARVLDYLAGSGFLTAEGEHLVGSLHERVQRWLAMPVTPRLAGLALMAARSHQAAWRAHHVRPNPEWVDRAAHTWATGQEAPTYSAADEAVVTDDDAHCLNRVFLAARSDQTGQSDPATVTAADRLLVRGDVQAAQRRYLAELDADPDDPRPWAGLGLALAGTDQDFAALPGATGLLLESPERVRATYRNLRNRHGQATDVLALAGWLAEPTGSS